MGDELRATNIAPKTIYNGAMTLQADDIILLALKLVTRLEPVIGDIVRGVSVLQLLVILKRKHSYGLYGNVEEEDSGRTIGTYC